MNGCRADTCRIRVGQKIYLGTVADVVIDIDVAIIAFAEIRFGNKKITKRIEILDANKNGFIERD